MSIGRPKKLWEDAIKKLPNTYEKDIIDIYKSGEGDVAVKCYLYDYLSSFSNDLWARWMIEENSFSELIKKGRAYYQCWWESEGRSIRDKNFNTALYSLNMMNRFRDEWKERRFSDITSKNEKIENISVVNFKDVE